MSDFNAWAYDRVLQLAKLSGPTRRFANNYIIDRSASQGQRRPHPYSTRGPYTSWSSLTDKSWSGRHRPPNNCEWKTAADQVAKVFHADGSAEPCPKSTMLFPAFAQYLTDGFIQSVMEKKKSGQCSDRDQDKDSDQNEDKEQDQKPDFAIRRRNQSNHQIDLCQLYGRTPEQTRQLRELCEEPHRRGRLKTVPGPDGEYAPKPNEPDGDGWRNKKEFCKLDQPPGTCLVYTTHPPDE